MAREDTVTVDAPGAVAFEVERFGWTGTGRLEVSGRWFGLRGQRFMRPALMVEAGDDRRRLLALLEHKPWAADDGEQWVAAFDWEGDPADLAAVELAVAPELAVELPPPTGAPRPKARRRREGSRHEARPPRAQALEAELAVARAEAEELRGRLAAEERARAKRNEDLKELRLESAATRDAVAAERDAALAQRDAVAAERDAAIAERDAAVAEREAAVAERDAAAVEAAKAAGERERAVRERAGVEQELTAAVEARDKARAERNAWLTRARAADDERGAAAAAPERAAKRVPQPEPVPPVIDPAPLPPINPDPLPLAGERKREAKALAGDQRRRLRRRPAPSPLPPGGILLPPTGPGSNRRALLPEWAPRVLVPLALVFLVVVVALLIVWAF
jgi:hypothetical protein